MHSIDNWLEITQQHLDSISDHRVALELWHEPVLFNSVLVSRTLFEADPDPLKRPRMHTWTIQQFINMGDITPQDVANRINDYWKFARAQHAARLPKKECDCSLGGAHEMWCHKWEAY